MDQQMASELVNTTIERYKENSKPSKETVNWKEIVHIVKMIEDLCSFISEEKVDIYLPSLTRSFKKLHQAG